MNGNTKPFLTVVGVIALYIIFFHPSFTSPNREVKNAAITSIEPRALAEEKKRWSDKIENFGAERAYEEFKTVYANAHFGIQHSAAHLMGELLYEKEGIRGLIVCDSTFAFGCYHSFFGQALAENGVGITAELDAECIKKFGPYGTGCQHGIGHGLMEYFGGAGLRTALEACSHTTQKNPLHGCTSGVFMEYNVPIILTADPIRVEARTLDPDNPYSPCDTLPQQFQGSCYYEIGQWWDKVYKKDYRKAGMLCDGLKAAENREACFLGIGNVAAPSSEYGVPETVKKCGEMPSESGRTLCLGGASWSFFASPPSRPLAPELCKDLSPSEQAICVKKSDMFGLGHNEKS